MSEVELKKSHAADASHPRSRPHSHPRHSREGGNPVLPDTWVNATIADICYLNPKNILPDEMSVGFLPMTGVPKSFSEKNIFEIKKWGEVKKGYTHFADGDTIFAKITPCFENSKASIIKKFPNGHGSGSTEYFVLRPIGGYVNPKLLLALVRTNEFLREGAANMSGSVGHKRVPKEFVESFIFPLAPLAEQQQIAKKLDELLAQVDTLKARLDAIPAILKRFRQSVLAAAVSGRLTEEWSKNNTQSKWVVEKLGKLTVKVGSGSTPKGGEAAYKNNGTPLIRSMNVIFYGFKYQGIVFINDEQAHALRGAEVFSDDVLLNITGASIGRVTLAPKKLHGARVNQHVCIVRPNNKLINKYLCFYFSSPELQEIIGGENYGVTRQALTKQQILDFDIPLPSVEEQTQIIRRVEQLFAYADQIEQRVKDAQARVNHLTQSILAKAFRGELTADWRAQNPALISGDNSAAALLQRIKAERLATAKPNRKATV